MRDAVVANYTEIEGTLLKETIVDAWMMGGNQLPRAIGKDGFIRPMTLAPEFVANLHARMMKGFRIVDNPERFRYLCNECGHRDRGRPDREVGRLCCGQCGSTSTRCDLVARVRVNPLPGVERR
jgi:hypothetical protein